MRIASRISSLLAMVGAMRWGRRRIGRFDMLRRFFLRNTMVSRIVYAFVGLMGILQIVTMTMRAVRARRMPAMG